LTHRTTIFPGRVLSARVKLHLAPKDLRSCKYSDYCS
jgi:hypothetical protein